MHTQHHTTRFKPLSLKFLGDDDLGEFEGYASTFGGEPDSYGDIVAPGAFDDSLSDGSMPVMLWDHDPSRPIGKWLSIQPDQHGLAVRGQLNMKSEAGMQAHSHLTHGDLSGLSIGYDLQPKDRVKNGDGTSTLKRVNLHEISVVALPSNNGARITGIKTLNSRSEFERLLKSTGLPGGAAKKLAAGGWPALTNGDDDAANVPDHVAATLINRIKAASLELKSFQSRQRHNPTKP